MPTVIAGSTSLGISSAILQELRSNGRAALTLIHSEKLDRIECNLVTTAVDMRVPVIVEDRIFDVPAIQASVGCGSGNRTGTGQFVFANDLANPILIELTLNFSWERRPRTVRVTRVVAGLGLQAEMRQALDTLGTYDVYGLLFDFDSAQLRPETAQLVREIAVMLQQNPNWVIEIAGHTDSIGGADHNLRLSGRRAASIKQALISNGVAASRLQTVGHGMSKPKADNQRWLVVPSTAASNSADWIANWASWTLPAGPSNAWERHRSPMCPTPAAQTVMSDPPPDWYSFMSRLRSGFEPPPDVTSARTRFSGLFRSGGRAPLTVR